MIPFSFSNYIIALQNLVDALASVETAVTKLSKNDANHMTAEGVYKFLFGKLQPMQTNIAKKLTKNNLNDSDNLSKEWKYTKF